MEKVIWLILANTTKADIYKIVGNEYALLQTLHHEKSRLKTVDLITDKAGRYKTGNTTGGKFIPPSDPHEEEHKQFAKEIASFLEKQQSQYEGIILCAEPHFYGLLNQSISNHVRASIVKAIEKDYIPLPAPKLKSTIETIIHEK